MVLLNFRLKSKAAAAAAAAFTAVLTAVICAFCAANASGEEPAAPTISDGNFAEERAVGEIHPFDLALGLGVPPARDAGIDILRSRRLDVPHPLIGLFGKRRIRESRRRPAERRRQHHNTSFHRTVPSLFWRVF